MEHKHAVKSGCLPIRLDRQATATADLRESVHGLPRVANTRPGRNGYARCARRQQGAALYVALVMLILLALIGLVGMQVSGLQERMAANYLRVNSAFQNAEGVARGIEVAIAGNPSGYSVDTSDCAAAFNAVAWAETVTDKSAHYVRKMDGCTSGLESNAGTGEAVNKQTSYPVYEITAVSSDVTEASSDETSSTAVIQTVYWP